MDTQLFALNVLVGVVVGLIVLPIAWIGVRGALRVIISRIKHLESEQIELETRVNRLQKQRAADASIVAREETRTVQQQAVERLSEPLLDGTKRPSVVSIVER
jgi:hypothetical protein